MNSTLLDAPPGPEAALRHSEEQHRVLLEVSNAILANLDSDTLYEAIGLSLDRILDIDVAILAIETPDSEAFRVVPLKGQPFEPSLRESVAHEGTHVGWVVDHGRPLVRGDLRQEAEFPSEELILMRGLRATMAVPLIRGGRAVGTLNVGSREPNRYSQDDARFLERMGSIVALALQNVDAYERIAELTRRLEEENVYLQEEVGLLHEFEEILGEAEPMMHLKQAIRAVAPTEATVLITGETGTGKELVARAVHDLSHRSEEPFIRVNCAAIPETLAESELFGHEKGAFTGAMSRRIGRFHLAHGGTIFLDEVGELSLALQAKLLRVLQEGEFERVGSSQSSSVDVRVIAATNRDLEAEIEAGRFRQDLFYRLNVFPVHAPALREHPSDIPLLVRHFVARSSARLRRTIESVPQRALLAMTEYGWPGNVRELEHVVERAVILSTGTDLQLEGAIPEREPRTGVPVGSLAEAQRRHIQRALDATGWKVSGQGGAAELLDIRPTTLESKMKRLGIRRPEPNPPSSSR